MVDATTTATSPVVQQAQAGLNPTGLSLGGIAGNITSNNTKSAKQSLDDTYNNFLTLLTTQLKNQDPLNPMDSKDFTSQLIQMSSAEQSIAQTSRIEDLLKLTQASTVNTALNYIGLSVDYTGNKVTFDGTTPVDTTYELPEAAATTQISVLNSDGKVVYSENGDVASGAHTFSWDGKDGDGNPQKPGLYTVEVGSQKADGSALTNKITVPGTVNGIETADGQVYLVISGQKVPIDAVKSAFAMSYYTPPATTAPTTGTATTPSTTDTTASA